MLGQPLVEERVVGRQQVEHAAVLAQDARDEQLVSLRNAWRSASSNGRMTRIRLDGLEVSQVEPLAGEVRHQRFGARIVEHAPHLLLEHRRVLQPALLGQVEQLLVRNAAPQEERQPRRELDVADAVRAARLGGRRDPARRGTGSPATPAAPRWRAWMPLSKSPSGAAASDRTRTAARCRRSSPAAGTRGARAS